MKCLLLIDPYRDTPEKCSWRKYMLLCLVFLIAGVIQGVHSQSETLNTENYGIIMSKNYPNNYPGNKETYTWYITVKSGNSSMLYFRDFDVSINADGNCTRDYVEVIHGDSLKSIFCGSELPPPIQSKKATMTIYLHVAGNSFSRGFFAEYISTESELVQPLVTPVIPGKIITPILECPYQAKLENLTSISLLRSSDPGNSRNYSEIVSNMGPGNITLHIASNTTSTSTDYFTELSTPTDIKLIINNPTCSDSGVYKCVYSVEASPHTYETFRRVYFVYKSSYVDISIYPYKKCHAFRSDVMMDCSMTMGPEYMGLNQILQWESKLKDETEWGPHFGGLVIDDYKEPDVSSPCIYSQTSTLNVVATKEMSGREFRCVVMTTGVEGNTSKSFKFEGNSTVIIEEAKDPYRPTKAAMTVDPDQTSYKPNTALIMTCTGSIGIQVPEQDTKWRWEYRRYGIDDVWKTYTNVKDIVTGEAQMAYECDFIQSTKLTLTLTENENNVEFRCIVVKTKDSKEEIFERESASYHIKEVEIIPATDDLDTNVVIGASLAALFLIIAAVIIACYIWQLGQPKKKEAPKPSTAVPRPVVPAVTIAFVKGTAAVSSILDEPKQRPSRPEPARKISSSVDPPPRRPSTSVDPPGYGRR